MNKAKKNKSERLKAAKAKLKKFKGERSGGDFDTHSIASTTSLASSSVPTLDATSSAKTSVPISPLNSLPTTPRKNDTIQPNTSTTATTRLHTTTTNQQSKPHQSQSTALTNGNAIVQEVQTNGSSSNPSITTSPQQPSQQPHQQQQPSHQPQQQPPQQHPPQPVQHQHELAQYQQQIQLQMQSIHHLVAEKGELLRRVEKLEAYIKQTSDTNTSSSQNSLGLKQKLESLQREHNLTKEAKQKYQKASTQLESELNTLNDSYKRVLSRNEELYERNTELSHQLNNNQLELNENKNQLKTLKDNKLHLESRIQDIGILEDSVRLKDSESVAASQQVEVLQDEQAKLQSQIREITASVELYKKTVQDLTTERHNLLGQIEQVNHAWQKRLETVNLELESLKGTNSKLMSEQVDGKAIESMKLEHEKELKDLKQQMEEKVQLEASYNTLNSSQAQLTSRLETQIADNETLVKLNMEQSDKISDYENKIRILEDQVRDRHQLLSSAENERSTLQRALQQNKDLKSQLTELQEALIQANNARAEAMTESDTLKYKLSAIQNDNNSAINNNNSSIQQNSTSGDKQKQQTTEAETILMAQVLADERLRSAQLQEHVDNLTTQLRLVEQNHMALQAQLQSQEDSVVRSTSAMSDSSQRQQSSPPQTPATDKLYQDLAQERLKSASLQDQMLELQNIINSSSLQTRDETLALEKAKDYVEKLELRLHRETQIHASMNEKLDQLEVNNAQLEAENETINEYVTLYREQRAALKKMQYDELQLKEGVDKEKEEMREKLEYLELLVKQLLADRTMTSPESPDLNEQELETTERILEVIDDVVETAGVECEPLQLSIPYYGPQWDI